MNGGFLRYFWFYGLTMLGVLLACPHRVAHAGEAELALIKTRYPEALIGLEQAYSTVKATGTLVRTSGGSEAGSGMEVHITVVDGMKKATVRTYRTEPSGDRSLYYESIYCMGRTMRFAVRRNLEENGPYLLNDVSRKSSPDESVSFTDKASIEFKEMAGKYLFAPFKMDTLSMSKIVNGDSFAITSAVEFVDGEEKVLRFHYESRDHGPGPPPLKGEVEVLPNRGWVMRRHEFNGTVFAGAGPNAPRMKYSNVLTVEYGSDRDGVAVPRRVRYSGTSGESQFTFDEVELGAITPEREFTPRFYGLPDVTDLASNPARSYTIYWLFGLATLALAAAIVIKKRGT